MEKWLYVMLIKKGKTFNKVTKGVITRHAEGFASYTLAAVMIKELQLPIKKTGKERGY